jgi:hypothetical protein
MCRSACDVCSGCCRSGASTRHLTWHAMRSAQPLRARHRWVAPYGPSMGSYVVGPIESSFLFIGGQRFGHRGRGGGCGPHQGMVRREAASSALNCLFARACEPARASRCVARTHRCPQPSARGAARHPTHAQVALLTTYYLQLTTYYLLLTTLAQVALLGPLAADVPVGLRRGARPPAAGGRCVPHPAGGAL